APLLQKIADLLRDPENLDVLLLKCVEYGHRFLLDHRRDARSPRIDGDQVGEGGTAAGARGMLPAVENAGTRESEMEKRTIVNLVGDTPLVELRTGVSRPGIRLLGKLEGNNPGGSVKDRPARSMILRAEERGELRPGMKLIEPTSGN